MKRLLLWLIVFAAVSGGLLHAQDIAGTWQGTLTAPGGGPALRIVVEVSKADDQSLKVVVRSIDQGGQPINAGTVTLQGSTFKFTVPAIGGNYEGRISDGNTIFGQLDARRCSGPSQSSPRHTCDGMGYSGAATSADANGSQCESGL